MLPLTVLSSMSAQRLRLNRASWFEPVHGFGEWVAFVGGILLALIVVAFALLYVIGNAATP